MMFIRALRWILVVPAAVIALILSYMVVALINIILTWLRGEPTDTPWISLIQSTFISGLSGFVFVYFGTKVAPDKKVGAAYALTGGLILLGGMVLVIAIQDRDWWQVISDICVGIGGLIALYKINTGDLNVEGGIFDFD